MKDDVKKLLPGLTASAYRLIEAEQLAALERLEMDWNIIRSDPSPSKQKRFIEQTENEVVPKLFGLIAEAYWNLQKDQETFLEGLAYTDNYIRNLRSAPW